MLFFQAGVPFPTNDTNPWVWIAGAMALALGVLFFRYDGSRDRSLARAESQVDEVLPALKANTDAINSTVSSGKEFRQFLVDLVAAIGAVAKVVSSLQDDHKTMNARLDAIERNVETCTRSCRESYERLRNPPDDDRPQQRRRSGAQNDRD